MSDHWSTSHEERAQDLFYMTPGRKIYVDPTYGSDGNVGNKNRPFKTVACGYAQMRDGRNDTMFIVPGASAITATSSMEIAKDNVNFVGLGPNQRHGRTAGTDGGMVAIRCFTTSIDNIFNITGNHVRLYNLETMNSFSHASNRCDVLVAGRNPYFEGCSFRGGNGALQLSGANSGTGVVFGGITAGAGNGATFKDCHFGNSSNDARSLGASCVLYTSATELAGYFNEYIDCVFDTRIETVAAIVAPIIVRVGGTYGSTDRYMLFRNCFFYNFWVNHADQANFVLYDQSGHTHDIMFMNCAAMGFDAWSNTVAYSMTNMADATSKGGIGIAVKITA